MATKSSHILMSFYESEYTKKYKFKPTINRFKCQYAFAAMIDQFGMDDSKAVIAYWLGMQRPPHKADDLIYNYEKWEVLMRQAREDDAERKRLREETKRRLEENNG